MSDTSTADTGAPQDGDTDDPAGGQDQPTPRTYDEEYVKRLRAESARYRTEARKHAEALEKAQRASMTDQERLVAEARAEARAEAIRELGRDHVELAVRAAAAGRAPSVVDALLEAIDPGRFLGDDGRPDTKAITAWVGRVAPAGEPGFPDLAQGARGKAQSEPDMNQLLRRAAGRAQ